MAVSQYTQRFLVSIKQLVEELKAINKTKNKHNYFVLFQKATTFAALFGEVAQMVRASDS